MLAFSTTLVLVFAGNVGADHAVFEQGASAGNVGHQKLVEQKKANPVALLLSSAMMLRHLQFPSFADRLETAVKRVISEGKYRTKDLGGDSSTQEIVDAVIATLDWFTRHVFDLCFSTIKPTIWPWVFLVYVYFKIFLPPQSVILNNINQR